MSPSQQPRRQVSGRGIGAFFILVAVLSCALAYWAWQRYTGFIDAPLASIRPGTTLLVERGDNFPDVLAKLHAAGAPAGHRYEWRLLARQLGAGNRLQAGEYALDPALTPRRLLLDLRDGRVLSHRFTIVEGWDIRQLRAALAQVDDLQHDTAKLDARALMEKLGHPGQHPEGRFLPETYLYTRGDSDSDLLARAYEAMTQALDAAWATRTPGLPLQSKDEALVLASIVEKETAAPEERAKIAGVFVRRLKLGMLLQTDPSVIYGMGDKYQGNIRKADLQTDTPYNTYTRAGLPPTPIAMPGAAALQAATHPTPGDALYFVAIGDGSGRHVFSHSNAEHQAAVRRYLQHYRGQQRAQRQPSPDTAAKPTDGQGSTRPGDPPEAPPAQ